MFEKNFDRFMEQVEQILASDPFTARLNVQYVHKKKYVQVALRSDKKVATTVFRDKADIKKLESLIQRSVELMTNRKVPVAAQADADGTGNEGGKKKGKRR
jgi:hypothetical protein